MNEGTTRSTEIPLPADDIQAHAEHDHIAAIFDDRLHAEAAVDDLRASGLGSEHLGVAVHGDSAVAFEHDTDAEMLHDAEVGAAGAAPIGFIAGMALAALAVPGIAVGGLLALAGVGAAWGAFIGAYIGFGVSDPASTEHSVIEETEMTELQPGQVLVVACSHGHADAVRETMQRHDGRIREFGPSHT